MLVPNQKKNTILENMFYFIFAKIVITVGENKRQGRKER